MKNRLLLIIGMFLIICSLNVFADFNTNISTQYYVVINATSFNQTAFLSGLTNISIYNLTPNKWIVYDNTTGNYEVARANIMKTLFYYSFPSRIISPYIMNVSLLETKDSRDINKIAYYATMTSSADGFDSNYLGNFTNNISNFNVSTWSYLSITQGTCTSCTRFVDWQLPIGYVQNIANAIALNTVTSNEIGIDTSLDNQNNPSTANFHIFGTSATHPWLAESIILTNSTMIWNFSGVSTTTTYYNINYNLNYSIPAMSNASNDGNLFNFSINTLINVWNNSYIYNFNATLDGIKYNTTSGSISFPILKTNNSLHNITISSSGYINQTFINYNISNSLNANLSQTIINFRVFDNVNNINLSNFTVYLNSQLACTTNTINCIGYPNNGTYTNLTLISNNNSFFTKTGVTANFNNLDNINLTTNVSSLITVNFFTVNSFNSNQISGFQVFLNGTNVCNASGVSCSYMPNISTYAVTITTNGLGTVSTNTTFNTSLIQNYTYSVFPLATFKFYDEKTNLPFNMSSASSITQYINCLTSTQQININTSVNSSTNISVNLSCGFKSISFIVYYGTTSYIRNIYFPTYAVDFSNISVYLMNLNTVTAVGVDYVPDDTLSQYPNPSLIVNKYINNNYVQITGGPVDISGKLSAYLIQNNEYIIDLYSNDIFQKQLGHYVANTGGTLSVRLYDILFGATPNGFDAYVNYDIYKDNTTYPGTQLVVANYNDIGNQTQSVVFSVYQESLGGTLLNTQYSAADNVQFLYNITPFNSNLLCLLNITAYGRNVPYVIQCNDITNVSFDLLSYINPQIINWFFLILISVLALYSTYRTANIMNIIIIGLAALVNYFKWLSLGTKVGIFTGFLAVAAILALMSYISDRNKEQI